MSNEARILFKTLFALAFGIILVAGGWLIKNDRKLFGEHPDIPGDHESGRVYNKVQIWVIWAHMALLTGVFALYLD